MRGAGSAASEKPARTDRSGKPAKPTERERPEPPEQGLSETAAPGKGAPAKPARRRGRPSRAETAEGAPGARERILESARAEFAARGYDKASIRAIARGAEVNPALVHHYFGAKEQVFAAAVAAAAAPATRHLPESERLPAHELGPTFTRFFFGIWENPATRSPLLAVLRSAVNNETAARIFRAFVVSQLLSRLSAGLDDTDAELRVELAAAHLVGVALLRYVLLIEPLASTDVEILIQRLSPVVQQHLTQSPETPETPGPRETPRPPEPPR